MVHTSVAMVITLLVVVACTGPTQDRSSPTRSPVAPSVTVSPSPASDIRFVLREQYPVGRTIHVRIENLGDDAYGYQTMYAACFLKYRDEDGRGFIIPPGTHCDILSISPIEPGQTKTLFKWGLDECTKDRWGCARARPLEPGTYRINGIFKSIDEGTAVRAEATFTIIGA